jgi:hypothetical protein
MTSKTKTPTTARRYLVQNADGIVVAQYDERDHAIESARENAAAGYAAMLDFYTVYDSVNDEEIAAFKATEAS